MIKLKNILGENSKQTYDYGCAMVFFNATTIIKPIHNLISQSDLYISDGDNSYGKEDEHHTTLLYGLHEEVTLKAVTDIIQTYEFTNCIMHNPSLFKTDTYDVLKYEVMGDNLHSVNQSLKKLPYTTSFPKYNPHFTIAYLKPGCGNYYVNELNTLKLNKFSITPTHAVYSTADGKKHKIKIKIK